MGPPGPDRCTMMMGCEQKRKRKQEGEREKVKIENGIIEKQVRLFNRWGPLADWVEMIGGSRLPLKRKGNVLDLSADQTKLHFKTLHFEVRHLRAFKSPNCFLNLEGRLHFHQAPLCNWGNLNVSILEQVNAETIVRMHAYLLALLPLSCECDPCKQLKTSTNQSNGRNDHRTETKTSEQLSLHSFVRAPTRRTRRFTRMTNQVGLVSHQREPIWNGFLL